jgi:hypothetical protein
LGKLFSGKEELKMTNKDQFKEKQKENQVDSTKDNNKYRMSWLDSSCSSLEEKDITEECSECSEEISDSSDLTESSC